MVLLNAIFLIQSDRLSSHGKKHGEAGVCDSMYVRTADSTALLWWLEHGQQDYPGEDEILIMCDGGGSSSSVSYLFKEDLQTLSNLLNLKIRIAHYPPYCSKYNPIEHLVFPHMTRACKGVLLESIETAKHYIEKTETTTGLKVVEKIIDKVFEKGRQYAADFKEKMSIQFDKLLPKWNYTAVLKCRFYFGTITKPLY